MKSFVLFALFASFASFASFAFLLPVCLHAQEVRITTLAGTGEEGFSGDGGSAAQAGLNTPTGMAVDERGNVYIADFANHRIRRVGKDGIIATVAGMGTEGFSGDGGPATLARLSFPTGVTVDARGNIYIADTGNNRVRRIDPDGVILTFAGVGHFGFRGDGGMATQASLTAPIGVAVDGSGAVYIADTGNNCIRRVGRKWTTFTTKDGLANDGVLSILQDCEGVLWFGTWGGGVSRYDGKREKESDGPESAWATFTTEDGLARNFVRSALQDRDGYIWFGTDGGGLGQYDGVAFTTFTAEDGLAHNDVGPILQDQEGHLWFGTWGGGVSRYDGQTFTTFTAKDGLASNSVSWIFQDREGVLWFGTGSGVSRYDPSKGSGQGGKIFTTFTTEEGLAHNYVGWSGWIIQDRDGHLWFSNPGGGVNRYDGRVFQALTNQDGLASNSGRSIFQDRKGVLWFGTTSGVTRFRPPAPTPPPVFIDTVVADRRYEKVSELAFPSSVKLIAFEFHAMNFKTRPEAMVYRYRLKGYDEEWRNTRQRRVEYQNLAVGEYVFEVIAVDRDLVYSEQPATVKVIVEPDPHIRALTEALSEGCASGEFIGRSESLRRVQAQLSEVARTDVTVLILGETGTGKGLAARAVHALSNRREGPFIQVNCCDCWRNGPLSGWEARRRFARMRG